MLGTIIRNNYPCQAEKLMEEINGFVHGHAFKYPEYQNPENDYESPYDIANNSMSELTCAQKKALIDLYNAYCITPQYVTGESITDDDKIKLMSEYQDEYRTLFHREEERIICTEAFRRLQYKTQVMVNSASDDQRTRLLHSLEVQKNARKIAIALNANYELAETIAIAHDIGHAPFGHAGEDAINKYLEDHWAGAFSHALQSVKVIDFLCSHRALKPKGLMGLGVSDLVLEGILKHDSDSFTQNLASARYRLQYDCPTLYKPVGIENASDYPDDAVSIGGIETQIVCWADKIAYMGHDWEEFVAVDLLEVMLSRVNSMVIKLDELCKADDTFDRRNRQYDHIPTAEKKKLGELNSKLETLRNEFNKDSYICNDYSEKDGFVKALNDLINVCDEILKDQDRSKSEFILFSKEQYNAFYAFFKIASSWMIITHKKPKKLGGKMDVIFSIYKYLSNTTSHRTVPALIHGLVRNSLEFMSSKLFEIYNRDKTISLCNQKWQEVQTATEKNIKSQLRKCFAVHFDEAYTEATEYINAFIKQEFINSTRVRYMTQKAETIINCLMDFYYNNSEMLPLKYRNRVEFEMNQEKIFTRVKELLKDYYKTKIGELSAHTSIREWTYLERMGISTLTSFANSNVAMQEKIINKTIDENEELVKHVIKLRVVADYVSGMTDRMAEMKYNEICSSGTRWSKAYSERGTFNL